MNVIDLEEALDDLLPPGYSVKTNKQGQIVILTNLRRDEDGELFPISDDDTDNYFDSDEDHLEDEDVND
jgi:hypothetical protein